MTRTVTGWWADLCRQAVRSATPVLLLAAIAVLTWWAGPWTLVPALIVVAAWRSPDPRHVQAAVELVAAGLVLILAAVVALIGCGTGAQR